MNDSYTEGYFDCNDDEFDVCPGVMRNQMMHKSAAFPTV